MPEGTVICQVEEKNGDRGKLARASGKYLFFLVFI
jgi:large subunit ribosomal protein L8e